MLSLTTCARIPSATSSSVLQPPSLPKAAACSPKFGSGSRLSLSRRRAERMVQRLNAGGGTLSLSPPTSDCLGAGGSGVQYETTSASCPHGSSMHPLTLPRPPSVRGEALANGSDVRSERPKIPTTGSRGAIDDDEQKEECAPTHLHDGPSDGWTSAVEGMSNNFVGENDEKEEQVVAAEALSGAEVPKTQAEPTGCGPCQVGTVNEKESPIAGGPPILRLPDCDYSSSSSSEEESDDDGGDDDDDDENDNHDYDASEKDPSRAGDAPVDRGSLAMDRGRGRKKGDVGPWEPPRRFLQGKFGATGAKVDPMGARDRRSRKQATRSGGAFSFESDDDGGADDSDSSDSSLSAFELGRTHRKPRGVYQGGDPVRGRDPLQPVLPPPPPPEVPAPPADSFDDGADLSFEMPIRTVGEGRIVRFKPAGGRKTREALGVTKFAMKETRSSPRRLRRGSSHKSKLSDKSLSADFVDLCGDDDDASTDSAFLAEDGDNDDDNDAESILDFIASEDEDDNDDDGDESYRATQADSSTDEDNSDGDVSKPNLSPPMKLSRRRHPSTEIGDDERDVPLIVGRDEGTRRSGRGRLREKNSAESSKEERDASPSPPCTVDYCQHGGASPERSRRGAGASPSRAGSYLTPRSPPEEEMSDSDRYGLTEETDEMRRSLSRATRAMMSQPSALRSPPKRAQQRLSSPSRPPWPFQADASALGSPVRCYEGLRRDPPSPAFFLASRQFIPSGVKRKGSGRKITLGDASRKELQMPRRRRIKESDEDGEEEPHSTARVEFFASRCFDSPEASCAKIVKNKEEEGKGMDDIVEFSSSEDEGGFRTRAPLRAGTKVPPLSRHGDWRDGFLSSASAKRARSGEGGKPVVSCMVTRKSPTAATSSTKAASLPSGRITSFLKPRGAKRCLSSFFGESDDEDFELRASFASGNAREAKSAFSTSSPLSQDRPAHWSIDRRRRLRNAANSFRSSAAAVPEQRDVNKTADISAEYLGTSSSALVAPRTTRAGRSRSSVGAGGSSENFECNFVEVVRTASSSSASAKQGVASGGGRTEPNRKSSNRTSSESTTAYGDFVHVGGEASDTWYRAPRIAPSFSSMSFAASTKRNDLVGGSGAGIDGFTLCEGDSLQMYGNDDRGRPPTKSSSRSDVGRGRGGRRKKSSTPSVRGGSRGGCPVSKRGRKGGGWGGRGRGRRKSAPGRGAGRKTAEGGARGSSCDVGPSSDGRIEWSMRQSGFGSYQSPASGGKSAGRAHRSGGGGGSYMNIAAQNPQLGHVGGAEITF